jgi:hypothetical protein
MVILLFVGMLIMINSFLSLSEKGLKNTVCVGNVCLQPCEIEVPAALTILCIMRWQKPQILRGVVAAALLYLIVTVARTQAHLSEEDMQAKRSNAIM